MGATRIGVILAVLAVAGCGHYEWRRISGNASNFNQADYSCQRDSVAMAPVAPVTEVERTRNERRVTTYDANSNNRENLYYSCMRAHGWAHVFIEDKAAQPAPALPVAVAAPPPPPPGAPPAPVAAGPFNPSGAWDSDGEKINLSLGGDGMLRGNYGDGTVSGRLNGYNFEGTWREASGDRACRNTADGVYWGRVTFQFAPDGRRATGRWGYCDDAPRKEWDLRR